MGRLAAAILLFAAALSAAAQEAANPPLETLPAIVLVLPDSTSPFARAAEAVRSGFFAAHAVAGAPVAIELRETGESAPAVASAIEASVGRGARMIVGPLARDSVDALARAGGTTVPVLALNVPSTATPLPASMLALGLRVEDEAQAIVRALVRGPLAAGVSTSALPFAVIVGSGTLERRAGTAFVAAVQEQGRRAEAIELAPMRNRLADLGKRLSAQPWQAILLALDAGEAATVRSRLPADVPVLATSRIHLLEQSAVGLTQDLDGIAFVDMPWLLESEHPAVAVYPRAATPYSAELERLYALGIDAYRVAAEWMKGKQRFELDGVTGRLRVDPRLGGRVERLPSLAVFVNGRAERRDVLR
jgi:outer membrane PBP1 activator LpoA protein